MWPWRCLKLPIANQHADSIDYEVTGAASLDLPFLHDLPFHQTGSFPLHVIQ